MIPVRYNSPLQGQWETYLDLLRNATAVYSGMYGGVQVEVLWH